VCTSGVGDPQKISPLPRLLHCHTLRSTLMGQISLDQTIRQSKAQVHHTAIFDDSMMILHVELHLLQIYSCMANLDTLSYTNVFSDGGSLRPMMQPLQSDLQYV
jgi:hypothetical protein